MTLVRHSSCSVIEQRPRRGVLLLIVLSLLTLFLMLGAAYLAAATRARTAAKAYSKLTFNADDVRIPATPLLDDVLLRVIRGPKPAGITSGASFESLLEDKYGVSSMTLTGTANLATSNNSAITTGNLTLSSGSMRPSDLVGRVITFTEQGRVATSHRVLRAGDANGSNAVGTSFLITLDKPFRSDQVSASEGSARVIINGREFSGDPSSATASNEPWDAFDSRNPFLARVAAGSTISNSDVPRASYSATPEYDNDGDGVLDSAFLDWDLPSFRDSAGNDVTVTAAVLVVDLDGRFNVNAHGSLAPTLYPDTHTGWTTAAGVSGSALEDAPLGSGYGPADVQFNGGTGTSGTSPNGGSTKLFDSASGRQSGENPRLSITVGDDGSRQQGKRPANSRYGQGAVTPRLGRVDGKYGEKAATDSDIATPNLLISGTSAAVPRPGEPNANDNASRLNDRRALETEATDTNRGIPTTWWSGTSGFNWHVIPGQPAPRGVFNSPPDLHGRMKTLTLTATGSAIAPQLVYAKPEWDSGSGGLGAETTDDPYELLLDTRRGVGGWLRDATASNLLRHNPFTLAELEPILRPYDSDTSRQPQRLAAMLGSDAEASRFLFTTESWDTTAITGAAAMRIFGSGTAAADGWLQTVVTGASPALSLFGDSPLTGLISGEVARGHKFDLNRPFDGSASANAGYEPTTPYFVQRHAYFKDFYTLLVALQSGTNALPPSQADALAQWAANVVKFRDADSRIIPFEYEQNIKENGWLVNSNVGDPGTGAAAETATRRVAWPAVRPEILIREVAAWNNSAGGPNTSARGMVISLHRPWNAKAYAGGTSTFIDAEPCDYSLDTLVSGTGGRPTNQIDLGKKADILVLSGTVSAYDTLDRDHYPIWRLRIVTGDASSGVGTTHYLRFDVKDEPTPTATNQIAIPSVTSGATKPKMAPDTTLTLYSGESIRVGTDMAAFDAPIDVATYSDQKLPVPKLQSIVTTASKGTVFLERLSDPSVLLKKDMKITGSRKDQPNTAPVGSDIWDANESVIGKPSDTTIPVRYVVVDEMDFAVIDTSNAASPLQVSRRVTTGASAFWKYSDAANAPGPKRPVALSPSTAAQIPGQLAAGQTAWFPWPSRPFISAAELLLVPQGDCQMMLKTYNKPDPNDWSTIGLPLNDNVRGLLFDAVQVPTRFSCVHASATDTKPADTSIFNWCTPVNQFSAYREPGRVNLNTITSAEVWNAIVAGPLNQPLVSGNAAALGIGVPANKAVKTMLEALSLESGGASLKPDTDPALPVTRNPAAALYSANRLANTVTTRSNLFAVWVTLKEEAANDPDSVRYHRGFYIVDRSIPVGFQEGKDHNVWDCVRLRRVIE